MDIRGVLQDLQPDTDNLIVLTVGVAIIYSTYVLGKDSANMVNTAIGGLIGYLGASAKSNRPPTLPPNVTTGVKP